MNNREVDNKAEKKNHTNITQVTFTVNKVKTIITYGALPLYTLTFFYNMMCAEKML